MDIIARLNSGALHHAARASRPECVDTNGNVHCSAERASFVDWINENPNATKDEYAARYVPSH